MTRFARARGLIGAAAFGLPAALLAHALVFGGAHAAGGDMHGLFVDAALCIVAAVLVLVAAASFVSAHLATQGSVVAARIEHMLPGGAALLLSTGAWFGGIEACERAHGIPFVAVTVAIAASALGVRLMLRMLARVVADVTIALCAVSTSLAVPCTAFFFQPRIAMCRASAHGYRRFSRPPPGRP